MSDLTKLTEESTNRILDIVADIGSATARQVQEEL